MYQSYVQEMTVNQRVNKMFGKFLELTMGPQQRSEAITFIAQM